MGHSQTVLLPSYRPPPAQTVTRARCLSMEDTRKNQIREATRDRAEKSSSRRGKQEREGKREDGK